MFYGRETELTALDELWEKSVASLVVCRGRRRIGKSTLIGEFDDNCLTLLPGRPRTLKFSASLPPASLSVTHLAELTTK